MRAPKEANARGLGREYAFLLPAAIYPNSYVPSPSGQMMSLSRHGEGTVWNVCISIDPKSIIVGHSYVN
jgi:hypothetical protein